ncbi:MAG: Hsp20 family protein [Treponema sp.]|jgi:HSP20 family molecular chaperone IbpA|nr:Hsp20 family protein [Treponema sp.]
MKGTKGYMDLGTIFDEIFEAAQNFSDEFHRNFNQFGNGSRPGGGPYGSGFGQRWAFDENIDYYPNYSYPPMNVYMTSDRSMIFEFALAGFDEKDISLSFQGDYMVFSAKLGAEEKAEPPEGERPADDNIRYFKRRLKMKDIEKQKYYVPLDKYAQEKVKAVYKNGILKVKIPPKDEPDQNDGIKIEIIKEGI